MLRFLRSFLDGAAAVKMPDWSLYSVCRVLVYSFDETRFVRCSFRLKPDGKPAYGPNRRFLLSVVRPPPRAAPVIGRYFILCSCAIVSSLPPENMFSISRDLNTCSASCTPPFLACKPVFEGGSRWC